MYGVDRLINAVGGWMDRYRLSECIDICCRVSGRMNRQIYAVERQTDRCCKGTD